MQSFKNYAQLNGYGFPVEEELFDSLFLLFSFQGNILKNGKVGFINNRLSYYSVIFEIEQDTAPDREVLLESKRKVEELVEDINRLSPPGVDQMWVNSYDNWAWLNLRSTLYSDSFYGVLLSLGFALVIILMTSHNPITSILAVVCVSFIIMTLNSVIFLIGWSIKIIESCCLIIFVGISVDYVVHIGHQYAHSLATSRQEKIVHAFRQIGQSIIGAALTSFISAIFLIMC